MYNHQMNLEQLQLRVKELERELDIARKNHKHLVDRCALLRQRYDLPVDRIPAYKELIRLQEKENIHE